MTRMLLMMVLAALTVPVMAFAQDAQPPQGQQQAQDQPTQVEKPEAGKEDLPEIDVWEDTEEGKDDVFVPSESISADSSIAFPSDI